MQKEETILSNFNTISLKEMDAVELMNRKDTKYFFNAEKLPLILSSLKTDYRVLLIENYRIFNYRNIYFDTEDFFCYYQHHNERVNRYKIRIRQYVESKLNFLEVKFKTNTNRTIKTRIKVPEFSPVISEEAKRFLVQQTPFDPDKLIQTLRNDFKRFTLISNDLKERATIDTGLVLMTGDGERIFSNLCIAELKHDASSSGSLFKASMRRNYCPEMRISKYSIGTAFMYPALKQNNWKEKKLRINRIEQNV
ncbi:MAG: polyphosphate polymerase domain-containing protein [Fimbriimonadaceae bacterium]|nr:polyphosphate polymerase domain-containing protein [Chitinophagales bacterium]